MSRIIRSLQAQKAIQHDKREIKIRNMFTPTHFGEQNIALDDIPTLSQEDVMAERDRLLAEARHMMELERQQFESFRQEQLQSLEQLKLLWEEEKVTLQQQAYDEGFGAGFEEGMQKAEAQMAATLTQANNILKQAELDGQKYVEDQESLILELGIQSAQRILGKLIEEDAEHFVDIVRRGLKEVREMQSIKVYVAAENYQLLSNYRDELAEMFPPDVQFLIFINEDFTSTECYIETNHGRVVVTIDEQLQQLRIKLNEILDSKE